MSLLHDMQISGNDFQGIPEDLRTDIVKKHSRRKLWELMGVWRIFRRDSDRLNSVSERVHNDLLGRRSNANATSKPGKGEDMGEAARLLLDQAVILEGEVPADASGFAERLSKLMQQVYD